MVLFVGLGNICSNNLLILYSRTASELSDLLQELKQYAIAFVSVHIDIVFLFLICMYSYERLYVEVEWLSMTQWLCVSYAVVLLIEINVVKVPAILHRYRSLQQLELALIAVSRGIETSAKLSACQGEVFSFSTRPSSQSDNLLNFDNNDNSSGTTLNGYIHTYIRTYILYIHAYISTFQP